MKRQVFWATSIILIAIGIASVPMLQASEIDLCRTQAHEDAVQFGGPPNYERCGQ